MKCNRYSNRFVVRMSVASGSETVPQATETWIAGNKLLSNFLDVAVEINSYVVRNDYELKKLK